MSAALALLLSYAILVTARSAALLAAERYQDALAANPLAAEGAIGAAIVALDQRDHKGAEALAREALSNSPLRARALSTLAYSLGERGQQPESAALMAYAARLSWRDETSQFWMLGQEIDREALGPAVYRTDALLEQNLRPEHLLETLRYAASFPDGRNALVERLAERPKWRSAYLGRLAGLTEEGFADHELVLRRLIGTKAPPSPEEIDVYIARLVEDERFAEAKAASVRLASRRDTANYVADPAFAGLNEAGSSSPFAWRRYDIAGVSVSLDSDPLNPSSRFLTIAGNSPFAEGLIHQLLVLPPGQYRLVSPMRGRTTETAPPVEWRLSCLGGPGQVVAADKHWRRSKEWMHLEQLLSVPAAGCPAQRLELSATLQAEILDGRVRAISITRSSL
jgi:hypothetical protein